MKDVITDNCIIGGGVAGLASAILLADAGLDVLLIERKAYAFNRVYGEYISNEALPFLKAIDAYPEILGPSFINKLTVSSSLGSLLHLSLEMGAFGLSRYTLDNFLYTVALKKGAEVRLNTLVRDVKYMEDLFFVLLDNGQTLQSRIVIGNFGKRFSLDRQLTGNFFANVLPISE